MEFTHWIPSNSVVQCKGEMFQIQWICCLTDHKMTFSNSLDRFRRLSCDSVFFFFLVSNFVSLCVCVWLCVWIVRSSYISL